MVVGRPAAARSERTETVYFWHEASSVVVVVVVRGGLGRLATWHLPGGPVGPPVRWAATSNVEVGQMKSAMDDGSLYLRLRLRA